MLERPKRGTHDRPGANAVEEARRGLEASERRTAAIRRSSPLSFALRLRAPGEHPLQHGPGGLETPRRRGKQVARATAEGWFLRASARFQSRISGTGAPSAAMRARMAPAPTASRAAGPRTEASPPLLGAARGHQRASACQSPMAAMPRAPDSCSCTSRCGRSTRSSRAPSPRRTATADRRGLHSRVHSRAFEPFSSLAGITGTRGKAGRCNVRRGRSLEERNERAPRNPAGAKKRMVR